MTIETALLTAIATLLGFIVYFAFKLAVQSAVNWQMLSDIHVELSVVSANLDMIKDKLVPEHAERVQAHEARQNG